MDSKPICWKREYKYLMEAGMLEGAIKMLIEASSTDSLAAGWLKKLRQLDTYSNYRNYNIENLFDNNASFILMLHEADADKLFSLYEICVARKHYRQAAHLLYLAQRKGHAQAGYLMEANLRGAPGELQRFLKANNYFRMGCEFFSRAFRLDINKIQIGSSQRERTIDPTLDKLSRENRAKAINNLQIATSENHPLAPMLLAFVFKDYFPNIKDEFEKNLHKAKDQAFSLHLGACSCFRGSLEKINPIEKIPLLIFGNQELKKSEDLYYLPSKILRILRSRHDILYNMQYCAYYPTSGGRLAVYPLAEEEVLLLEKEAFFYPWAHMMLAKHYLSLGSQHTRIADEYLELAFSFTEEKEEQEEQKLCSIAGLLASAKNSDETKRGFSLMKKIADEIGTPEALYQTGLYYQKGIGTPCDNTQANAYYAQAASLNYELAQQALDKNQPKSVPQQQCTSTAPLALSMDSKHDAWRREYISLLNSGMLEGAILMLIKASIADPLAQQWLKKIRLSDTYNNYQNYSLENLFDNDAGFILMIQEADANKLYDLYRKYLTNKSYRQAAHLLYLAQKKGHNAASKKVSSLTNTKNKLGTDDIELRKSLKDNADFRKGNELWSIALRLHNSRENKTLSQFAGTLSDDLSNANKRRLEKSELENVTKAVANYQSAIINNHPLAHLMLAYIYEHKFFSSPKDEYIKHLMESAQAFAYYKNAKGAFKIFSTAKDNVEKFRSLIDGDNALKRSEDCYYVPAKILRLLRSTHSSVVGLFDFAAYPLSEYLVKTLEEQAFFHPWAQAMLAMHYVSKGSAFVKKADEYIELSFAFQEATGLCKIAEYLHKIRNEEKRAFQIVKKLADEFGDSKALFQVGLYYDTGVGIQQDFRQAQEYYKKAAHLGNELAQRALEKSFSQGIGVVLKSHELRQPGLPHQGSYDDIQVLKAVTKNPNLEAQLPCEHSDLPTFFSLEKILGENIENTELSYEEIFNLLEKHNGNIFVNTALARHYLMQHSQGEANQYKAFDLLKEAHKFDANPGVTEFFLGLCYWQGIGTGKNKVEAEKYFKVAQRNKFIGIVEIKKVLEEEKEFNSIDSIYSRGLELINAGQKNKARYILLIAAYLGHLEAQYTLGCCYRDFDELSSFRHDAHYWFDMAAKRGHKDAQEALKAKPNNTVEERKAPKKKRVNKKRQEQRQVKHADAPVVDLPKAESLATKRVSISDLDISELKPAALSGDREAQFELARRYVRGVGGAKVNYNMARAYLYKFLCDPIAEKLEAAIALFQEMQPDFSYDEDDSLQVQKFNKLSNDYHRHIIDEGLSDNKKTFNPYVATIEDYSALTLAPNILSQETINQEPNFYYFHSAEGNMNELNLGEDDLKALKLRIISSFGRSNKCKLVPACGEKFEVKKIRFRINNIENGRAYFVHDRAGQNFALLSLFQKNKKADISASERQTLKDFLETWPAPWR